MATGTDYSFRIGTFNTHLDSWVFDAVRLIHINGVDDVAALPKVLEQLLELPDTVKAARSAQAHAIADRIRMGGFYYDVIALNEVFHEDARAILASSLNDIFPYQITKVPLTEPPLPSAVLDLLPGPVRDLLDTLTPGATFDAEDSGLMLLSRFPIASQEFVEFTDSSGWDGYAAKGALYVKLMNTRTDTPLHLVATHLQDNTEHDPTVRAHQLATIKLLLQAHLSTAQLNEVDVFLLGDFNISGNLTAYPGLTGLSGPDDPLSPPQPPGGDLKEYADTFGPAAAPGVLSKTLRDTWLWHTSVRDRGATSTELDGSRLDLLLHNDRPRTLVPQHLTVAYNLCSPSGVSSSDHYGLNAEFNRPSAYATPRTALVVPAKNSHVPGVIEHPWSMQWYRIDEPGTFCPAATPDNPDDPPLLVHVYAATDLSRAMAPYRDLSREIDDGKEGKVTARLYALATPPYYLRVRSSDDHWTGAYTLHLVRNQGQSAEDAVIVDAYATAATVAFGPDPLNAEDTAWFRFDLERADTGQPQHCTTTISNEAHRPWQTRILLADQTTEAPWSATADDVGATRLEADEVGPGPRYALVQRTDSLLPGAAALSWTTNLTILHPQVDLDGNPVSGAAELDVICDDETDPETGGSDTIDFTIISDGQLAADRGYIGEFDDGDRHGYSHLLNPAGIRYVEKLDFQLVEDDEGDFDDYSPLVSVPTLSEFRRSMAAGPFQWEDGTYRVVVNLSHRFPPPA